MRKPILLFAALLLSVFCCENTDAQSFWKKLEKGIKDAGDKVEKVSKDIDEVLGTDDEATTTAAEEAGEQTVSSPSRLTASTPSVKVTKEIIPHTTPNTKTIYLDQVESGFDYMDFGDGRAFVKKVIRKNFGHKDSRWGVIDSEGNLVIDYVFDFSNMIYANNPLPYYNSGVCMASSSIYPYEDKNTGPSALIIDKQGNIVKAIPNANSYTNFKDSIAHIRVAVVDPEKSTSLRTQYYYKYMYVNTKGEAIYPHLTVQAYPKNDGTSIPNLSAIHGLSEGLRAFWDYKNGYGFIDKDGKIIIEPAYRLVHDFREGLAAVQNFDEKWGFIDKTGKLVIDFTFSNEPTDFYEGLALVRKRDNTECYINTTGTIMPVNSKLADESVYSYGLFMNGKAFLGSVRQKIILDRDLNKYKILDSELRVDGKKIFDYKDGLYYFRDNNDEYIYILDDNADVIYHGNYFRGGIAKCLYSEDGDLRYANPGFMNKKGEIIVLFKEPEF